MCARHLHYWHAEPDFELTCPGCGWSGSTSPDLFEELAEYSCPTCDVTIALVPYPTAAETRAAAAGGNPRAQADLVGVEQRERWLERAASLELKLPSELPDLRGANLRITWDLRDRGGENWTVLRRRRKVLWRELAYWEGYERFAAVFEILHARYGDRLAGVRPTPGSETYLYGDKLNAWQNVDRLNRSLRNS